MIFSVVTLLTGLLCITNNLCANIVSQWIFRLPYFNPLARWRSGCNTELAFFKFISWADILGISYKIVIMWMPQDLTDDWLTLTQVMACCLTAPRHYLNQCWLISKVCGINQKVLAWDDLKMPISKTRLKIIFLESHSDFPGANEFKYNTITKSITPMYITKTIDTAKRYRVVLD